MRLNLPAHVPPMATALSAAAALMALSCPQPTLASPFNGLYAGLEVGYEGSGRIDGGGVTYGGILGYNARVSDRIVLGAEARIAESSIGETIRRDLATTSIEVRNDVGRSIGGAVRAGYLLGNNTLLFGRLGYESTRFHSRETRTPKPPTTNPNPTVNSFHFDEESVTLGAGLEQAIANRVSLRATYEWAERFDRHQLRVGVAYRF